MVVPDEDGKRTRYFGNQPEVVKPLLTIGTDWTNAGQVSQSPAADPTTW